MICVIAGEGELPVKICQQLKIENKFFLILTFHGIKHSLFDFNSLVYKFKLGEIGTILTFLKEKNITEIIMCGKIKFPGFTNIKFDTYGLKLLPRFLSIKNSGDDNILKEVVRIINEQNIKISAIQDILPSLLASKKDEIIATFFNKKDSYLDDIAIGFEILDKLSDLDIGQGIVIQNKRVLAIEAAEGTDEMIKRSKNYILKNNKKPILIKTAKINQDKRCDMPVIGKNTILNLIESGFSGIAVRSGQIIIIDKEEIFKLAKKNGINIFVLD